MVSIEFILVGSAIGAALITALVTAFVTYHQTSQNNKIKKMELTMSAIYNLEKNNHFNDLKSLTNKINASETLCTGILTGYLDEKMCHSSSRLIIKSNYNLIKQIKGACKSAIQSGIPEIEIKDEFNNKVIIRRGGMENLLQEDAYSDIVKVYNEWFGEKKFQSRPKLGMGEMRNIGADAFIILGAVVASSYSSVYLTFINNPELRGEAGTMLLAFGVGIAFILTGFFIRMGIIGFKQRN